MAAGPRVGFGHLVRCRSLARVLGVAPVASVRGTPRTRRVAAQLGWTVIDMAGSAGLRALRPDLLVVDDPSSEAASVWVRRARDLGVAVATIHDLGLGHVDADLVIDGSVGVAGRRMPALCGPRFTILDPAILQARQRRAPVPPRRVLIAMGGGSHVSPVAVRLSRAIAARVPDADIRVARGFAAGGRAPALPRASWVDAPDGLSDELSRAAVAVVAGGVTLYEACAVGVPVVAVALTPGQHTTIRRIVSQGAAIDGGGPPLDGVTIERAAEAVAVLIRHDAARRKQARHGRRLVDARGAFRVADGLRELIAASRAARGTADQEAAADAA